MLFYSNAWITKEGNPLFHAIVRNYDGEEVSKLVILYFLGKFASLISTKILQRYRDDGLELTRKANGPKTHRIKKDVIALFKSGGLSISIDTNLIATDFLDVSFKLEINKFFSYTKRSSTPPYIHSELNHPHLIIKKLPSIINKRISSLSWNENEFNKANSLYESALKYSGFN